MEPSVGITVQNEFSSHKNQILCCRCGTTIESNPANMCVPCLRSQVDISEGIPKQATLLFCRGCERYLQPPDLWVRCQLESRELMTLCLKKLKGLSKVRLTDASFIWTEPHSKRIKVKLTVQKEVFNGAILQQLFVVEFTVAGQMCDDCRRTEAKDYWRAMVQVRQKTDHKKTFYYLEQLILKHKAHEHALGIKPATDGLDFFYASEAQARKLVEFLECVVPCRTQHSKKLISHDIHSNTYNYKYTFSVEIVPVCKDNIVCLPAKLAHQLGGISQLCIVKRVTTTIGLIDPATAQIADVSAVNFWRNPFTSLCGPKQLSEYTVMDVEVPDGGARRAFAGQGAISNRHVLADVWVVRSSELGLTENTTHTRSHLGHLLKPGDTALGFDLANSNVNNSSFDKMKKERVPDVILVKKVYANKAVRNRRRKWRLKHLDLENIETGSDVREYTDFLEDLEEDPQFRENVNIYRDSSKLTAVDTDDVSDACDAPEITLQEMLDDLQIGDDATGGEGAPMLE